jgi:4-amino-4-deoxy-L-arabinose transferase-like glycosyltransferase
MPPPLWTRAHQHSPIKNAAPWLCRTPTQLGLLFLVVILCLFLNPEAGDLSLMEARNFITAREMVSDGHWLLPTLNGQLRLAKPPLPTWITALTGLIIGNTDHIPALRFPAAIMAALLVLFTFLLARQLTADRLIPFLSAVVLATSLAFVKAGRQGTWDI